jgi:hypothetical protein
MLSTILTVTHPTSPRHQSLIQVVRVTLLLPMRLALTRLQITLPNGQGIAFEHTSTLDLPNLPMVDRQAHILPESVQYSLLSIGQLFDSGCEICFTTMAVAVNHNETVIISGGRYLLSDLWHVDMTTPSPAVTDNVYDTHTVPDRICYLHAACFGPVKDTWIKAIENGDFATCPGLTVDNVRTFLPK